MFGLYFSFDLFKYINFNLKINLPLLLSEQTTVLGKVLELLKSYDTLTFINKDTSCKVLIRSNERLALETSALEIIYG